MTSEARTADSPIHRLIWQRHTPLDMFQAAPLETSPEAARVIEDALRWVRRHRAEGTLYAEDGKVRESLLRELGEVGYWGLLVDPSHGGAGATFRSFAPFLTRMAMVCPPVAGLASAHGCIGAVNSLRHFGTPEQRRRLLPDLARGRRLSAFALTEPAAGSDLTALRTTARRAGDDYLVTGEKVFITNAMTGRVISLVCLIDGQPAVLIAELPDRETAHFQLRQYDLHALRHTHNLGLFFRDFPVPADNRLVPPQGNGLTIAYHGLNRGRVAVCAMAAGTMRSMLAALLPWTRFRVTYGLPLARRELVCRRIARLAALIVGCDALVAWCSTLIDQGQRGELEGIVAKVFGSEAQKEAAIELLMKTQGGRSFLRGHLFGDNLYEYLAPCIYEGEGELLSLAFFKTLVKQHARQCREPLERAGRQAGIARPNLAHPMHLWRLRRELLPYASWLAGQSARRFSRPRIPSLPADLETHARFAVERLAGLSREIDAELRRHGKTLADRQCRMALLSQRAQKLTVMLCATLHAGRQDNELPRRAADVLARQLTGELTGRGPSDRDIRAAVTLGETIAREGFPPAPGSPPEEPPVGAADDPGRMLLPYDE